MITSSVLHVGRYAASGCIKVSLFSVIQRINSRISPSFTYECRAMQPKQRYLQINLKCEQQISACSVKMSAVTETRGP